MRLVAALSAFFALSAAQTGWAGNPASPADDMPVAPATESADGAQAPVSSGIRVFVDPLTGRPTSNPTAEQRRAAAAQDALNRNLDGHEHFTYETLPSGAVMLRTHGRNQSVVVAKPGPTGKAVVECTDPLHQHLSGGKQVDRAPADDSRDER
jgi:hypothetical protein